MSKSHLEKRLDLLPGLEVVQPPPLLLLVLILFVLALGLLAAAVRSLVIRVARACAPGCVQGDGSLGHAGHGVENLSCGGVGGHKIRQETPRR